MTLGKIRGAGTETPSVDVATRDGRHETLGEHVSAGSGAAATTAGEQRRRLEA